MADAPTPHPDPATTARSGATRGAAAPPVSPGLAESWRYGLGVTRTCAPDLYRCLKLAPEPGRSAMSCVLAFLHASGPAIVGGGPGPDAPRRLEQFTRDTRRVLSAAPDEPLPPGPLWPALRQVVQAHGVAPGRLMTLLEGRRDDLLADRYATFEDLYGYCYKVASAPALAGLDICGHDGDPGVSKLAEYRGVAMQLTDILRGLVEDARRGRVYLPREDMDRFGCTIQQIGDRDADANFNRLVVFEAERARSYYQMSEPLERHLAASYRPASWAILQVHRRLLERIARSPRRVLHGRIAVGRLRRLEIAARAAWQWTRR